MRVAIIDRFRFGSSWYTAKLIDYISRTEENYLFCYAPKNALSLSGQLHLLKVWTKWLFPFQIFRKVSADQIDIIHIQFEFGAFGEPPVFSMLVIPLLWLLKLAGIRSIVTIHGPFRVDNFASTGLLGMPRSVYSATYKLFILPFYLILARFCDRIVVLSSVFEGELSKMGIKNVTTISHGVDNEVEDQASRKAEKSFRLLFFGTISQRKGLDILLDAIQILAKAGKHLELTVAGGIPFHSVKYAEKIRQRVMELSSIIRTSFIPNVAENQIQQLFDDNDVLILPYLDVIAASGPLSQGIAFHIPIIATNNLYNQNYLGNLRAAILVEPDPESLARAIDSLEHDLEMRKEMSLATVELAKKYSWGVIATDHINLYKSILSTK